MDAESASSGAKGTDWTADQVVVAVPNYFIMLGQERAGAKAQQSGSLSAGYRSEDHQRARADEFWLSRNQCEVAAKNPETYRIRRVYHFRNGAAMFDVKAPLEVGLWLTPDKYIAVSK